MGARSSRSETSCFAAGSSNRSKVLAEPLRVAISGAAGQIGYSLLPMIAEGEMFGRHQRVVLQCLDLNLPTVKDNMRGIEMELQDGNFKLLDKVSFTTDDSVAFKGADYAILLGAFPQQDGKEKRETMEKNSMIFRTIGHAIECHASKGCKVLVVGHPACTNALLCAHHAPALPKDSFTALTRLDQNRAAGQLAQRAGVPTGDVRNVAVWGGHLRVPDVDRAEVGGRPVREVLLGDGDRKWLAEQFVPDTQRRGACIHKVRKASSAMSAARAIVDHIHDLHCGTRPGEFASMGVWSDGNEYGVHGGLIFSMPTCCPGRGRHQIAPGLRVSQQTRRKIAEAEAELLEDRRLMLEILARHNPAAAAIAQ